MLVKHPAHFSLCFLCQPVATGHEPPALRPILLSLEGVYVPASKTDNPRQKDSDGQLHGQFRRKFPEVAVVILISLAALGAGKFPCCKPDEGNRVSFGSASSHVLTESYSVIAFRVFARDAIISLYGHVGHLNY